MINDNDPYSEYSTCVRCGKFSDTYRCAVCEEIGKCQECVKKTEALNLALTVLGYLNQNITVDKIERLLK